MKTLKSGLFSAALAALVTLSIQDLIPNPQDTSAFYLKNIYQLLANQSVSNVFIGSTVASPPPFSPPPFAVWLNSLWFLSLVVSLTSALLATSVQQWARRYLKVTRLRYSLHERARIRAFFHRGVERWHLSWAAHVVSILQHLSLHPFSSTYHHHLPRELVGSCPLLFPCNALSPPFIVSILTAVYWDTICHWH